MKLLRSRVFPIVTYLIITFFFGLNILKEVDTVNGRPTDIKILILIGFSIISFSAIIYWNEIGGIKRVMKFDLLQYFLSLYHRNKNLVSIYFYALLILIIAYAPKFIFLSFFPDDYGRYFMFEDHQSQFLGRWFGEILLTVFFSEKYYILPYFNSLVFLIFLSLSGLFTVKIWLVKNRYLQLITILVTCIAPYWAHVIHANTEVAVPIGLFLCVFSVFLLYRDWKLFPISLILLACGIGVYQSVLQVTILLIGGRYLVELVKESIFRTRQFLQITGLHMLFILIVFIGFRLSTMFNDFFMAILKLQAFGRYAEFGDASIVRIILNLFHWDNYLAPDISLPYLSYNFYIITYIFLITGVVGLIFKALQSSAHARIKAIKISAILIVLWLMVVTVSLINLLGIETMPYNFFSKSWFMAILLISISKWKGFMRNITVLMAAGWIIISTWYISVFFDAASRQTRADILRANQIVTAIRLNKDYPENKKRLGLMIVGNNDFPVLGWTSGYEALS